MFGLDSPRLLGSLPVVMAATLPSNKFYLLYILPYVWKFFSNLRSDHDTLGCILQNWEIFSYAPMKEKMIFYCNTAWPRYSLRSGEQWPLNGALDYNTIFQLELFCKREGKWDEIAYA